MVLLIQIENYYMGKKCFIFWRNCICIIILPFELSYAKNCAFLYIIPLFENYYMGKKCFIFRHNCICIIILPFELSYAKNCAFLYIIPLFHFFIYLFIYIYIYFVLILINFALCDHGHISFMKVFEYQRKDLLQINNEMAS